MIILNQEQIKQKIKRMAMEIYEHHADEKQVFLAGINNKGFEIARLLEQEIQKLSPLNCVLIQIRLDPAAPTANPVQIDHEVSKLKNKVVIITDDVANTGRTVFYSFKVLMDILPKKLEVAVLIERTHKCFPVQVDIVGLRLATTLNENIEVSINNDSDWKVELN